jgi:hypothetical protein
MNMVVKAFFVGVLRGVRWSHPWFYRWLVGCGGGGRIGER